MFFRELILVGLLTSLMLTVVLYITIGDFPAVESAEGRSFPHSHTNKSPQLRGVVEIDNTERMVVKYFTCNDQSSTTAVENDNFCDCTNIYF
jgi:hypothetical protein